MSPRGVTLHHQVGQGNPKGIYLSAGVSAHFWIPRAAGPGPLQHVDTAAVAWHGGSSALNGYYIGVETEGCASPPHADPLTDYQLNQFASLMKWANQTHGIPLQLANNASTPGLNYHRCPGGGVTACPCDVRVNARAEILRRAGGAAPAPAPPPPAAKPPPPPPTGKAPPWPGVYLKTPPNTVGGGTRTWQQQMRNRGWSITVDDIYGPASKDVCTKFQREKGLAVDGIVGPDTWRAAWEAPVT